MILSLPIEIPGLLVIVVRVALILLYFVRACYPTGFSQTVLVSPILNNLDNTDSAAAPMDLTKPVGVIVLLAV